jgi:uncharacterized protein
MRRRATAPASWVHLLQALAAREGVERLGLSSRRVAELLGVAPSAVSQYLSGKRLEKGFARFATDEGARAIARSALEALIRAHEEGGAPTRVILQRALALSDLAERPQRAALPVSLPSGRPATPQLRQLARWIRLRVKAEQVAVTECMRLAQRARDELTRGILRQIASDSLRHAEIVSSLLPYVDRGVTGAYAAGITRKEIESLIESERRAEAQADEGLAHHLTGTMAILVASMEADERKHTELLRGLLQQGFRG